MIQIDFIYGDEKSSEVVLATRWPQVPTIGDVVEIEGVDAIVSAVHWIQNKDEPVAAIVYLEDRDQ